MIAQGPSNSLVSLGAIFIEQYPLKYVIGENSLWLEGFFTEKPHNPNNGIIPLWALIVLVLILGGTVIVMAVLCFA
jgi:hypothetical protein